MEIAIGIQHTGRELRIEVDADVADVRKQVDDALNEDRKLLWIEDRNGKQIAIPTDKLAYVELGADRGDRAVGFAVRAEA